MFQEFHVFFWTCFHNNDVFFFIFSRCLKSMHLLEPVELSIVARAFDIHQSGYLAASLADFLARRRRHFTDEKTCFLCLLDKQSLAWEIRWQFSHRMLGAKTVHITQSYLLRLSGVVWPRPKLRPELDIHRPMAVQVETNSGSWKKRQEMHVTYVSDFPN